MLINGVLSIVIFIVGLLLTLIPYVIFELRHNFLQSRSLFTTIVNAIVYNSASVGQTGLKPNEIIWQLFIIKPAQMLSINKELMIPIYLLTLFIIIFLYIKKKISFTREEKNILLYLLLCFVILTKLYISSKNPVWDYHFIGTEILFIILLGIILKKIRFLEKVLIIWVSFLVLLSGTNYIRSFSNNPYAVSSLATKKYIVNLIYKNAGNNPFVIYVYSPAIYTYDFDYLRLWLGKDIKNDLSGKDINKADFVYLIIPQTKNEIKSDFINYKTPQSRYKTVKEWHISDGTSIIKRSPININ